jgi:hypothetical protein
MFKLDKFTWAIIIVVVLVLAAAVITVNLTGGEGWGEPSYLNEDTPEAVVHNAFLAFMNQDLAKARQYYTEDALAPDQSGRAFLGEKDVYRPNDDNQRLRIKSVKTIDDGEAVVIIAVDHFAPGGLFDGGDTWSREMRLKVVREEGDWKIDTPEFFY